MTSVLGIFLIILWLMLFLMLGKFGIVHNFQPSLKLPQSWNELGDALGAINGLLSILSVLIAMHAISKQGKQISGSIEKQQQSNDIIARALEEQQKSNKISALNAVLTNLTWDNDRLEEAIKDSKKNNNGKIDNVNASFIENANKRKSKNLNEMDKIKRSILEISQ